MQANTNFSFTTIAALLIINCIFASSYVFGKIAVDHFPPLVFAAMRTGLTFLLYLPFLTWDKKMRDNWKIVATFGFCMGGLTLSTTYLGLHFANGSSSVLVGTQLSIPMVIIISHFVLKEKIALPIWIGVWISVPGAIFLGYDGVIFDYKLSVMFVTFSAFCYAVSCAISRSMKNLNLKVTSVNAWCMLIGCLFSLPISMLLENNDIVVSFQTATTTDWLLVLHAALVVNIMGHLSMFWLLNRHEIGNVMPYYVLTPLLGLLLAVGVMGEQLSWQLGFGATLIIIGISTINIYQSKQMKKNNVAIKEPQA